MKKLYTLSLLICVLFPTWSQTPAVDKYDIRKKRLLIQICSMYLYNANQGAIDVDSSVVLACKAYKLPVSLAYDQGFNEGSDLIGYDLIAKGNVNSAIKLLAKTKNEQRIELLFQLINYYLFKPGAKPDDLKNAYLYITQAVDLSNQLKIKKWQNQILLLKGKYYFQAGNPSEGKKYLVQVINQCRKENNKRSLADALDAYGSLLSNLDPEKEKLLTEAMSNYAALGLEEKRLEPYMKITTIYFWTGRFDQAKKRLYQNLVDLRKINFTHQQFTETTITYIEIIMRNIKSAMYYALKSVKRMEAENDYTFGDIFYMRLGDVYNLIGHHEEALELYKKSIEIGQQTFDNSTWYKSFYGAVAALSSKGKNKEALAYINSLTTKYPPKTTFDKMSVAYIKANCYEALKDNVRAEKFFNETDYFAQQLNAPETYREIVHQYTMMALFYININKIQKAEYYTNKVFSLLKTNNKRYNTEALQLLLYKNDSINGNYKSSLVHFKNYKKITDSIHGNAQNKQIEELKIQYETKNKEQKILLLNDRSKLQESELQKSKLLNNLSIGSLVLLLITISLLYSRYRLKQRNHAKLELKEREINQKNINLRHLLDEKEWLVKEIHHRVKNNLQTVISLLNSQSAYLDNDMALSAIKNSQHRIHAMSLIHQKLYSAENVSTINMPNYIKDLVGYLKDSFSLGQRVRFEVKIDPLELDVVQAVPLGLILNEAITNAIKYAFPNNKSGIISVSLESMGESRFLLTICDNGIGIDTDFTDKKADSFGMSLIKGLTDDLDGIFTMETNNGTSVKVSFTAELPIAKKYVSDTLATI